MTGLVRRAAVCCSIGSLTIIAIAATIPGVTLARSVRVTPNASFHPDPGEGTLPRAIARWRAFISEAARRFNVPIDWIAAAMAAESGGQTMRNGHPIVSHAGAMGLMQVMPATWATMRARYALGADPHDPHDNIIAGTAYLRLMYDRFGYPGLFGAYNAGPARYAAYLEARTPLPTETRAYVARLARRPATPTMPPATLSGMRLFFAIGQPVERPADTPEAPPKRLPTGSLFVPLTTSSGRDR